jgi:hypothetical protein
MVTPADDWVSSEERVSIECAPVRIDENSLKLTGQLTRREGTKRTVLRADFMSDGGQVTEDPITIVIEPENLTKAIKFRFPLDQGVGYGDAQSYSDYNHRFIVVNIFAGTKNLLDRRSSVEVSETGRYAKQQHPEKITSVADCNITRVNS